ncbi:MAG TPA: DICT sensory domain-containing protein [Pyrinomonadaceae bacterium]|nr:DICT sensory domain-containing protein [Pyrinomonadaceae bacterium]
MKNFSIFEHAVQILDSPQTENLGLISNLSRHQFVTTENLRFRASAPCLEYAALMIENELLLRTNRTGRIYAGFEKFSNLQPIIDRYLRIADISESVNLFGEPDWIAPRHPHIRYINLTSEFKLAREWFLIAESSTLQVALVAYSDERRGTQSPEKRLFNAIKTSHPTTVSRLALATDGVIDWSMAASRV